MTGKYDDIINLSRPISKNHKQMSVYERSAQFAPFAALTGYDESINEAGRKVDLRVELGYDKIEEISRSLSIIDQNIASHPTVKITYFKKDKLKDGGEYITISERAKKIDSQRKSIILFVGNSISFEDIVDINILLNN